jgi:hypothetical protein
MLDLLLLLIVFLFAFIYEVIDSSLGQGYGTLGTPTFILLGLSSKVIVPSILISQSIGGLIGSWRQHVFKNVDFSHKKTDDIKKVYFIVVCGITGVLISSFIGVKVSKDILTTYIGVMVLAIGILILSGIVLKFSWKKLAVIGFISAFNKGMSGGGYGPIVAGGQTVIGVGGKKSVGITNLAEAPICITGFAIWASMGELPPIELMASMCVGSGIASMFGAWITYKLPHKHLKTIMGVVVTILGILCLAKMLNP